MDTVSLEKRVEVNTTTKSVKKMTVESGTVTKDTLETVGGLTSFKDVDSVTVLTNMK